jgi:hypothetical protein
LLAALEVDMSLAGLLLGLIDIAITVAVLLLIGAIVLWVLQWVFSVSVPANVQKLYIGIVALIALYELIALVLGLPVMHLIGRPIG